MSHWVSIERLSGNVWIPATEPVVRPGEFLRLKALNVTYGKVLFSIATASGPQGPETVLVQGATPPLSGGDVWVDVAGPRREGVYVLWCVNDLAFSINEHKASLVFSVRASALPPPAEPPPAFEPSEQKGTLQTLQEGVAALPGAVAALPRNLVTIGLVALAVVAAVNVLPMLRKR